MWNFKANTQTISIFVGLAAMIGVGATLAPHLDHGFVQDAVLRFGPAAVVLLVALGIVFSPIPSGVIAMVAGAVYGAYVGGLLTILGAVLGASCAFGLSRYFGRGALQRTNTRFGRLLMQNRSQVSLTAIVFASRLVPFVSFDAISYVAGLTSIRFTNFFFATLLGTAPVCFAFAAAGASAAQDAMSLPLLLMLSGITLVLPACLIVAKLFRKSLQGRHVTQFAA